MTAYPRTLFALLFTCSLLLVPSGPASAEDDGLAAAEKHFNAAQSAYTNGEYSQAAAGFENAYEARPLAPFLFNIGAAYEKLARANPRKLGHWNKAIENYRAYLEKVPDASDADAVKARIAVLSKERKRIEKMSKRKRKKAKTSKKVKALAEVSVRGLVVVETEPENAELFIDDKAKGPISKTPWSGTLEGEHTIYLEKKGYKPHEMTFTPSPDKLMVISVALAADDYLGWVNITSNVPGADIFLDDKSVGAYSKTPFSGNLKPGKHDVWVTAEGYDEHHTTLEVVAGETHEMRVKLKGSPVGYLDVRGAGIEKAKVYVDGDVLCTRGPCRKAVPEGTRKVVIKRKGYKPLRKKIDIEAKTEVSYKVTLAKKPSRGDAILAYIFGAAFVGGGVFLGIQSQNLQDQLDRDGVPADDSQRDRVEYYKYGSYAAYGVGGLTLLTAVYYTFRDKGPKSEGTLNVGVAGFRPQLGDGYAGLGWAGSF